ncbi:MAG: PAS domain S-box protein [Cyclobacteriaceae bacterium]|nr:PAS domain S-box protein [Cyclobacteriaceae bacterium]
MHSLLTYKSIFDASPDAIFLVNDDGVIVETNDMTSNLLGYKREEFIGKKVEFLVPDKFRDIHKEDRLKFASAPLARNMGMGRELIARHKDGHDIQVEISLTPIETEGGKSIVCAVVRDIRDKLRAAESTRGIEKNLKEAQRIAKVGSWEVNILTGEVSWSEEMYRIYDVQFATFVPTRDSLVELIYHEDRHIMKDWIASAMTGINTGAIEFRVADHDGNLRNIVGRGEVFFNETGVPVRALGTIQDITERKQAEAIIVQNEKLLNEAQRISHVGSWELDLVTSRLDWSDEIYRIFEISPENFGASYDAFLNSIHPDDRELVNEAFTSSVMNKMPCEIVHRLLFPDGRIKFVREKCETYYDDLGNPLRSLGTVQDITHLRLVADELAKVRERLQLATESSDIGIWDWDVVNNVLIWDEAMYRLYGIEADTFSGAYEAWEEGLHPEDLESGHSQIQLALEGKKKFDTEFRVVWPDQSVHFIKGIGTVFRDEDGRAIRMLGTNWDITSRKLTELALIEQERKYKQVVDNISDGLFIDDISGKVVFANDRFLEMFELSHSDLEDITLEDYVAQEFRDELRDRHNRRVKGEKVKSIFEYIGLTKSGERRWFEVRVSPVLQENKIIGTQSAIRDITVRKVAEETLALQNEKLIRINKELEQFAFIASHDMREPLLILNSYVDLLVEEYGDAMDGDGHKYLEFIHQSSNRMKELINALLEYSRIGKKREIKLLDMKEIVTEAMTGLKPMIDEKKASITVGDLPKVTGLPNELVQLFSNLISNAIKYTRKNEQPAITIEAVENEKDWTFAVKDKGIGIDKKYFDTVFVIFKRLHNRVEYDGTGIGLAHCKKIVELHGGTIWVESEQNEGSQFFFTLSKTNPFG